METWGRTEWRLRGTSCEKEGWKGHSGEGGTDEGGREGGSVGEEDGGRRQHSPFLFLQIKLQTYEKYWSWSVAEVSPHPAAGVQTGPVYRLSVTSSHFKAFCPSQSPSSELPESPCCRSYRRRMSLIYRLNFTPQDVHHMLSFAGLWAVGILFTPAVTTTND